MIYILLNEEKTNKMLEYNIDNEIKKEFKPPHLKI